MADRQWMAEGVQVFETGTEQWLAEGVSFVEDQAAAGGATVGMAFNKGATLEGTTLGGRTIA